jgi:hypothetical protein
MTQLNSSKTNDTNAPMQSEALMKERWRTIAWHPQHVAHYLSYHGNKSSSTGQTTNFSLPPSSLFDLDLFEDLWPNGIELWHIHEIRPHRQSFPNRIDPEPLMITQQILVERKNQPIECALQSNQNLLESAPKVDQISVLPDKLKTYLHDIVDIDARLRKSLRSAETKIVWDVLRLKKQHRCEPKSNNLLNGSSLQLRSASKLQSRDWPLNRL